MTPAEAVLAAQDRKFRAQTAGDRAALADLLDEAMRYVHANGRIDSRDDIIDAVLARPYLALSPRTRSVAFHGDTAVITGVADIAVHERLRFDAAFTDVWRHARGWRNIAWQSTIIPA